MGCGIKTQEPLVPLVLIYQMFSVYFLFFWNFWLSGLFLSFFSKNYKETWRALNHTKNQESPISFSFWKGSCQGEGRGLLHSNSNSASSDFTDILEEKNASINLSSKNSQGHFIIHSSFPRFNLVPGNELLTGKWPFSMHHLYGLDMAGRARHPGPQSSCWPCLEQML